MRRRLRASPSARGPRASSRPRRVRNGSRRCAKTSEPDSSCRPGSGRREGTPARRSPRGPTRGLSDAGFPPARMTADQVLAMVSQGRVGLASQVRRVSEAQSTRTVSRPEFGYAFPRLNLPSQKLKGKHMPAVVGFVALNPNLARALDVARQLAMDPKARDFGFWYSAHLDWIPAPLVRRARLFQMWNGFWVAPLVESSTLKPGAWLNVYLLAFNLTEKDQQRSLRGGS